MPIYHGEKYLADRNLAITLKTKSTGKDWGYVIVKLAICTL